MINLLQKFITDEGCLAELTDECKGRAAAAVVALVLWKNGIKQHFTSDYPYPLRGDTEGFAILSPLCVGHGLRTTLAC